MLIRQTDQKSAIFAIIGIFQKKLLSFKKVYSRCHDLLMISANLSDIAILKFKSTDCGCLICIICKNEAINVMQNADLNTYYHV